MVTPWLFPLVLIIILQRLAELYIAHRNRMLMLTEGAKEFGSRHYPLFFLLHIGWLVGLIVEASLWGAISPDWYLYFGFFVFSQGLRYWSILSLGQFWNTRILVIPGRKAIRKGPYCFFRHPNYIAVTVELVSVPLIFGAVITAAIATILNLWLLLGIRIPVEEKALALGISEDND